MSQFLPYILVMAIVTYLIRMLPITFFHKQIRNRYIQSFLYYIPYAVLAAMTFPAIFYASEHMIASCIGTIVGIFFAYRGKSLLFVAIVSCLAILLVDLLFF